GYARRAHNHARPALGVAARPDVGTRPKRAALPTLQIEHQIILLDRDREGLGDVGPLHQLRAGLDRDGKLSRAGGIRIAPGLPGADVELPAVPGAAQEFLVAGQPIVAGSLGLHQRDDAALAQRTAGVRTAI